MPVKDKRLLVLVCFGVTVVIMAALADPSFRGEEDARSWQWRDSGSGSAIVRGHSGGAPDSTQELPPGLSFLLGMPLAVNTATVEELQLLPAIGPKLAANIDDYRGRHGPVASAAAFMEVPGIGPRLCERLVPLITFD